jgi:ubiquinone/menaquinone biosynthesis C-methylase UbiE
MGILARGNAALVSGAVPFESHTDRYERWFERHQAAYCSEMMAVRAQLPLQGLGIEVGVGSGRFAAPLGVAYGVDPSLNMLRRARERGIAVVAGVAEALPFTDDTFDFMLAVTTICFVDDIHAMLAEARRVLKRRGSLIIGFIDRESPLGQRYVEHQAENLFYREATFYSAEQVSSLLTESGFDAEAWVQTLSQSPERMREAETTRPGRGHGAFVVVRAKRLDG